MLEVLRSGQLSLGPLLRRVRAGVRRAGRRAVRERRVERDGRAAPGAAGGRRQRRRRGDHEPVLVRRQRQRGGLRAGPAGVRRHRPGDAEPRPSTPPRRRSRRAPRRCCRCTCSAIRPTSPRFERLGLPIVEDACEALGAVYADGVPVGGRGHPAVFGFYANKQLTTGEGGMVTIADRGGQGADRLRAQPGPRARTWTGSTTTGSASTTGSRTSPARSGSPSSSGSIEMLAGRARVAALYREALAEIEGLELPCPDAGGNRAGLVRVRRPAAARGRPRRGRPRARPRAGSRASRTSRRST